MWQVMATSIITARSRASCCAAAIWCKRQAAQSATTEHYQALMACSISLITRLATKQCVLIVSAV